jgi:hypothetical protein
MNKVLLVIVLIGSQLMTGCATSVVPMATKAESAQIKKINAPDDGKAGIFIFREDGPIAIDKWHFRKRIWIDSQCIGTSSANVFFYIQVEGDKSYEIATESLFTPNRVVLMLEKGKTYFFEQHVQEAFPYPSFGATTIEQVSDKKGREAVSRIEMAKLGGC